VRVDQALVERSICESREKAKRAIMAGAVKINGRRALKASDQVGESDTLTIDQPEKFVSRGGAKLEHALEHFQVDVRRWRVIDIGASTGGFTDCLLQRGAGAICAVDVGQGQLAWKLRTDARVTVMDKTNARALTPGHFTQPFQPFDLAVIDCSFISLQRILAPAIDLVKTSGKIIALIKPQFEAGKHEADRGAGVIKDPQVHDRVIAELKSFVEKLGTVSWMGVTASPLLGAAGNKEFLLLLEKRF